MQDSKLRYCHQR